MTAATATLPDALSLRRLLLADAGICFLAALLLMLGGAALESLLGLPAMVLRALGGIILAWSLVICLAGRSVQMVRRVMPVVAAANLLWAAASLLVLLTGLAAPSGLGGGVILAQAAAVAGIGLLQFRALRQPLAD